MKRKQRADDDDDSRWTTEEIDIAHILRTLPRCRTWFFNGQMPIIPTRNRSSIQTPPQIPAAALVAVVVPSSNPVVATSVAADAVVTPPSNPVVASSPDTPLSFPVTESDEKTHVPSRKKSSLQRKRERYLKIIEDLTKTKDSFNQELETLKRHYEDLKDINLKLKAKEQELINGSKSDYKIPHLEIHEGVQLGHTTVSIKSLKSTAENEAHKQQQQMQMANQTNNFETHNGEGVVQFQYMFSNRTMSLQMTSNVDSAEGPLPLPNLNISNEESTDVESCQSLDESKTNKDEKY